MGLHERAGKQSGEHCAAVGTDSGGRGSHLCGEQPGVCVALVGYECIIPLMPLKPNGTIRIYHDFAQGQGNPPECQDLQSTKIEAC